ncbi:hypothetical protein [Legionella cardiaca]|uniref:Uncharacterized protein n=1 Tax=Legionella cardiaca TaxID=1071983 RepID=A0ABY8AZK1_9GAMM|nr:hypothetical protein [Legionella cardiaca]WED44547.1 hypothetical protein PXX05_07100 [Legionella cardiaca]
MHFKVRIGGIFLDSEPKEQLTSSRHPHRYRLFHSVSHVLPQHYLSKSCDKANSRFHTIHAQYARKSLKENYIIILLQGELSLWKKGSDGDYLQVTSQSSAAKSVAYNYLKTILHISTTLLILNDMQKKDAILNDDIQSHLQGMIEELKELQKWELELEQEPLALGRQLTTLLLQQLQTEQSLQQLVVNLHHQQKSLLQKISQYVTAMQLHSMHAILLGWELEGVLIKAESRAAVVGTQGPRKGMIEVQYFQHYFKDTPIDHPVFYAEMPPQLMGQATGLMIIEYLSKELCNNLVGEMVFNNKKAMQEDILHAYAAPVLEQLSRGLSKVPQDKPQATRCPYSY